MADDTSSAELTTEAVELGEGMLGIIGAYGMRPGVDVRDLYLKVASESPTQERTLASADRETSEAVRPRATG